MRPTSKPGTMPAIDTTGAPGLAWRKSSHSSSSGNCVELAVLDRTRIAVRDSMDPGGPMLSPSIGSFANFVRAVGEGRIVR